MQNFLGRLAARLVSFKVVPNGTFRATALTGPCRPHTARSGGLALAVRASNRRSPGYSQSSSPRSGRHKSSQSSPPEDDDGSPRGFLPGKSPNLPPPPRQQYKAPKHGKKQSDVQAQTGTPRTGLMRLSVALAQAGVASRRGAEEVIKDGRVKVNGEVITVPQHKVDPAKVKLTVDGTDVGGKPTAVYCFAVNKPKGYVCSSRRQDGGGGRLVIDLFDKWLDEWVSKARREE
ncbi:hypothetical protein CYMTET_27458, partial [Cymbomonas tetramitiformis]